MRMVADSALGLPDRIRACLFDLDGVLTDTASVHRKAWKSMFDEYLKTQAERIGGRFVPFDIGSDYQEYVDGKKREDGVRSFLDSRGITLPTAIPMMTRRAETVHGLGNRKNALFQQTMHKEGVEVFEGRGATSTPSPQLGSEVAVVSSSANTREVLELTGLAKYVQSPSRRSNHARGRDSRESPRRIRSFVPRNCSTSRRIKPRCSRTQSQGYRPGMPAISAR